MQADPRQTRLRCGELDDGPLRRDCWLAGAEALAGQDPEEAAVLCGALEAGLSRDECFFQLAERSGQSSRCTAAGRFAEDCRMHGWTRQVMQALPEPVALPEAVARLGPLAEAAGFSRGDLRPWIAAFRHVHGQQGPLSSAGCAELEGEVAGACVDAAKMLLHDRMSYLRDTGGWPCGAAVPELVELGEDAVLQAVRDERRQEVCP